MAHVHWCVTPARCVTPLSGTGADWPRSTGCAVIGFILCSIPRLHYPVLLAATAMVGATAFMLGVDCFTTAGLKEVSQRRSLWVSE